jgi:hypothetical protein
MSKHHNAAKNGSQSRKHDSSGKFVPEAVLERISGSQRQAEPLELKPGVA